MTAALPSAPDALRDAGPGDLCIAAGVQVSAFDEGRWVVSSPHGRNVLVNDATVDLLDCLRDAATIDDARDAFARRFGTPVDADAFRHLLHTRLGGYGILEPDAPARAAAPSYIKLRIELLGARAAGWLAAPLRPLYDPRVFWLLLAVLAGGLAGVSLSTPARQALAGANAPATAALVAAAILVHELGHVAACARAGLRHGGIGFGLYAYVLPVMYADITDVWRGTRQQRFIANLGGVFAEVLYAVVLFALHLATGATTYLAASLAIAAVAGWQLTPLVRSDGYWVLADLIGVPNLAARARQAVREGLRPRALARLLREPRSAMVWLYGVTNALVLGGLAAYTLYAHGASVVRFPAYVARVARRALAGTLSPSDLDGGSLAVVLLYLLLARWTIGAVRTHISRRGTRTQRDGRPTSVGA